MKIYFDVSTINPDKVTGVGVYILQLLRHFSKIPGLQVIPVVKASRFKKRHKIAAVLPQKFCQIIFPWKFSKEPHSLYHGPDFKLNTRGSFPRAVTVHDMVVFEQKYNQPEFYKKGIQEMTQILNGPVDAVIANSHFTKGEILKHFPHLSEKIFVTHLGCDRAEVGAKASSISLPEKYILFLGTLEKRKNVAGVIKSFELLKQQHQVPHKLVLAGTWGFGFEEIQKLLKTSTFASEIVHLSYVPNESLSEVYKKASVFFFPSFYEGFGIPALEAMSLGCPVVVSSGGALEEVCEQAALSAPAEDHQALSECIARIIKDSSLQEQLRSAGYAQAKKFTWQKCAEQTFEVYKGLLEKKLL